MYNGSALLMKIIIALVSLLGCCAATAVTAVLLLNPAQALNETQSVVMHEYLAAFCSKDDRHDKQFVIGTAAAMSRIVVKANLGPLALAEYAKCKIIH